MCMCWNCRRFGTVWVSVNLVILEIITFLQRSALPMIPIQQRFCTFAREKNKKVQDKSGIVYIFIGEKQKWSFCEQSPALVHLLYVAQVHTIYRNSA